MRPTIAIPIDRWIGEPWGAYAPRLAQLLHLLRAAQADRAHVELVDRLTAAAYDAAHGRQGAEARVTALLGVNEATSRSWLGTAANAEREP